MEKEFQRWTAKRKVELLLQLIRGETKLVDACREHVARAFDAAATTVKRHGLVDARSDPTT